MIARSWIPPYPPHGRILDPTTARHDGCRPDPPLPRSKLDRFGGESTGSLRRPGWTGDESRGDSPAPHVLDSREELREARIRVGLGQEMLACRDADGDGRSHPVVEAERDLDARQELHPRDRAARQAVAAD